MSRNIAESLLSKDQFEPAYEGNLIQTCEQLSRSDPGDSETALVRAQLPAIDGDAMADVFAARWAGADRRNLCSVDAIIQCKCGSDDSCLVLAEFKNRRVGTVERKPTLHRAENPVSIQNSSSTMREAMTEQKRISVYPSAGKSWRPCLCFFLKMCPE